MAKNVAVGVMVMNANGDAVYFYQSSASRDRIDTAIAADKSASIIGGYCVSATASQYAELCRLQEEVAAAMRRRAA